MVKIKNAFIKILLVVFFAFFSFYQISKNNYVFNVSIVLNQVLRPLVLILIVMRSAPVEKFKITWQTTIGVFLSFAGVFLFKASDDFSYSKLFLLICWSSLFFYLLFVIYTFLYFGENFGFLPAYRGVSKNGAFSIVRHPLYASYFYSFLILVLSYPNILNFSALILFGIGIYIRTVEEEKVLFEFENYVNYALGIKNRFYHPLLVLPFFIFLAFYTLELKTNYFNKKVKLIDNTIHVISTSEIFTLNPIEYDEWGAVFLGNHIYPRLSSNQNGREDFSFGKLIDNTCLKRTSKICQKQRLLFFISPILNCNQRVIDVNVVKNEIKELFEKKNWLFKDWQFCDVKEKNELCLEFNNEEDVERKLQSVYVRFGWSLDRFSQKTLGAFPYCLNIVKRNKNLIIEANLYSRKKDKPSISFKVGNNPSDLFDLSLYGTRPLNNEKFKKLLTHTPSAFYVISNPKLRLRSIPWYDVKVFNIITQHFKNESLIVDAGAELDNFIPKGFENSSNQVVVQKNKKYKLFIPNFVSKCELLANNLNNYWVNLNFSVTASCENISYYIPEIILKNKSWEGFILPLTPGGYFKNSLLNQYFLPTSSESWLKNNLNYESYFKRIGITQTFVVTSPKFCSIRPNPLGLSDLLVDDLMFCN